jgi:hypothetical protein
LNGSYFRTIHGTSVTTFGRLPPDAVNSRCRPDAIRGDRFRRLAAEAFRPE